jgi:hypothetical protein
MKTGCGRTTHRLQQKRRRKRKRFNLRRLYRRTKTSMVLRMLKKAMHKTMKMQTKKNRTEMIKRLPRRYQISRK